MVTIYLTAMEKGKLLRILQNMKEYKKNEYKQNLITLEEYNYDVENLSVLIDRVNGQKTSDEDLLLQSWKYKSNIKRSHEKYEEDEI